MRISLRNVVPSLVLALVLAALALAACAKRGDEKRAAPAKAELSATAPRMTPATEPGRAPVSSRQKIIHEGQLGIEVASYRDARHAIDAHLERVGGHVAHADVAHGDGDATRATLVVRVPTGRFQETFAAIAGLGKIVEERTGAEDVSEAYADLEARLSNARRLETRLLELVAQRTSTVADLLAVEQELARVRGEIEAYEAQQRVFDDRIAMSTLTLTVSQRTTAVAQAGRSLGTRAGATLSGSWSALRATGEALVLVLAALAPWSPVLIGGGLAFFAIRRRRARARAA